MTKQEAVQKVQEEIDKLIRQSHNPFSRVEALAGARKLQWAISIFQQVETKED